MNEKQYQKELKKIKAIKCTNRCIHCRKLKSLRRRAFFERITPFAKAFVKYQMEKKK